MSSRAARLAQSRQQRSMERMTQKIGNDAEELIVLRAKMDSSNRTIDLLESQIHGSEQEMLDLGAQTARMQSELEELRLQLSSRVAQEFDSQSEAETEEEVRFTPRLSCADAQGRQPDDAATSEWRASETTERESLEHDSEEDSVDDLNDEDSSLEDA